MNREDIPIVRRMIAIGPQDPVFDTLILIAPVLIILIAVLGRSVATMVLAGMYLVVFVLYTGYKAVIHTTE